ncbi:MAG: SMI1/KNR4 family protein [Clostridiales bacterium]|nr:SMI1/KNR4 family protein [Clostridiales bacterium]
MDMDAVEFIGGVSANEIDNAIESLSVAFPESYKAFLTDFGGDDAGGEMIFGIDFRSGHRAPHKNVTLHDKVCFVVQSITNHAEDDVVIATQMERGQGLPKHLLIIGFWNDTFVCLDTSKMNNGECPVVEVNDDYSETEAIADTSGKFLYEYLSEE